MATLVQSAQSAENLASLAFGSNVTAGNLLVVVAGIANSNLTISHTVSDTLGNTWIFVGFSRNDNLTSNDVGIFIATANGSGACTVTVSGGGFGGSASQIIVAEYSGTFTLAVDSASVALQSVWRSRANDIILSASYYTGPTASTVGGSEVIVQNTSNADRSMVLSWEQPAATGAYTSSLSIGGTSPGSVSVALRETGGSTGRYIRQAAASGESISNSDYLPTPVLTGSLLVAAWGIANNNMGSFLSIADTLGSTWNNGVKFDTGNGVSFQYATLASGGFDRVSGGTGGSACQVILLEIADHDLAIVSDSDGGTTPQPVTLGTNNMVFTASYYTGSTAASISSGGETLLRNQLFADRSISLAFEDNPASGAFTSQLTGGSSPAFVTIAFEAGTPPPPTGIVTQSIVEFLTLETATARVTQSIVEYLTGVGVSCNNPPAGEVGTVYAHTFTAGAGDPPYTFTISAGSLPPGLSLNAATGDVTGIPGASGIYAFTVTVTDSLGAVASVGCSIAIAARLTAPDAGAGGFRPYACGCDPEILRAERLRALFDVRRSWPFDDVFPQSGAVPVLERGTIAAPAAGFNAVVLSYTVPPAMWFFLTDIFAVYAGGAFLPGDALWSVTCNAPLGVQNFQAQAIQGLDHVPIPLGSLRNGKPWPFRKAYRFAGLDLVQSVVANVNLLAGNFTTILLGYTLPMQYYGNDEPRAW